MSPAFLHRTSMASATATEPNHPQPTKNLSRFIQSTSSHFSTFFTPKAPPSSYSSSSSFNPSSKVVLPILFGDSKLQYLHPPIAYSSVESAQPDSLSSKEPSTPSSPAIRNMSSKHDGAGFPSTVKVSSLKSAADGAGPAFVGQVFSMCDLSGTGLMAVSTHFDIPFLSKRYKTFSPSVTYASFFR